MSKKVRGSRYVFYGPLTKRKPKILSMGHAGCQSGLIIEVVQLEAGYQILGIAAEKELLDGHVPCAFHGFDNSFRQLPYL